MQVTQKEIFFQYLISELDKLENDVIKLRQTLRYRNIDTVDCLELVLAMERLNAFRSFRDNSLAIFKLSSAADYKTLVSVDYSVYVQAAKDFRKQMKEGVLK